MLHSWCECWNVCGGSGGEIVPCYITHVGGNIFIPLVYINVCTIQLNFQVHHDLNQ